MPRFKVGDWVMLKRGGPVMTVDGVGMAGARDFLRCVWVMDTKDVGVLPAATLKP